MTILRKAKPVLLTEAIVLGIFGILFIRLVVVEPGVHREHILWTIRGCLIGPFETLINPQLSPPFVTPHWSVTVLLALVTLGFMSAHLIRPSRRTMFVSIAGTLLWILCGLIGAWTWT